MSEILIGMAIIGGVFAFIGVLFLSALGLVIIIDHFIGGPRQ